jgi:phosphatidylinositol 4-kinase
MASFLLQAHEHERFVTWYNPLSLSDMAIPGEDNIVTWRSQAITEKQWLEQTRTAWEIAPALAVFLPSRFAASEALTKEVTRLVRLHPMAVSHIPDAVHYLVTAHSMEADAPEVCCEEDLLFLNMCNVPFQLSHMLTWTPVSPVHALGYFSRQYPPHPISHQYAIKCLRSYPPVNSSLSAIQHLWYMLLLSGGNSLLCATNCPSCTLRLG